MKTRTKHLIKLSVISLILLTYVIGVFYLSQPKYIDNINRPLERYDWVSIAKYSGTNEVKNGIIVQVNNISNTAVLKINDFGDDFYTIFLNKPNYRIIGKGTIYHKVNDYVGFNIMILTQVFIGVLLTVFIFNMGPGIWELIKDE
jgi:hypothetical protein